MSGWSRLFPLHSLYRRAKGSLGARLITPDPCPPEARKGNVPARILISEPLAIYTMNSPEQPLGAASAIGPGIADRSALFCLGLTWHMENRGRAMILGRQKRLYERKCRRHRILLLGNSPADVTFMSEFSDHVHLLNHNSFVNEEMFRPLLETRRRYDAVLVARMTPWKRHELTSGLESVAHIFFRESSRSWPDSLAYFESLKAKMPTHDFINKVGDGSFERLPQAEVNRFLNMAHVGLCLSAEEGAMFASMEYLLAGLPVVSTLSRGGREYFFDQDYCLIVPPDPRAVRDAVATLKARRIPPAAIRDRTLVKLERERNRFLKILSDALPEISAVPAPPLDWRHPPLRGAYHWLPLSEIEREVAGAAPAGG